MPGCSEQGEESDDNKNDKYSWQKPFSQSLRLVECYPDRLKGNKTKQYYKNKFQEPDFLCRHEVVLTGINWRNGNHITIDVRKIIENSHQRK